MGAFFTFRRDRLIPAHAGKTLHVRDLSPVNRAHPRSRGENSDWETIDGRAGGSSPLTRGKRRGTRGSSGGVRLIPAHAGKTLTLGKVTTKKRAHPRSRGENSSRISRSAFFPGSSPLTRGKHGHVGEVNLTVGLIPAHAGKTDRSPTHCTSIGAHPRSRGENLHPISGDLRFTGSSPLTRGKLRLGDNRRASRGLIPAHAGKTARHSRQQRGSSAHPRSRGENPHAREGHHEEAGSSPLTRGKRGARDHRRVQAGLIPAHAGKTARGSPGARSSRAHPRSRGENTVTSVRSTLPSGSSPLTRGKPRRRN